MDRIGRYEIRSEIGRGGFGVVYRAFDPTVGRHVAVKVLTAHNDPTIATRFRAEATTVGSLQHKNIVTVFESGEQQGVPYLVMEYMEGSDLQQILRLGAPLTMFEKIEIMGGVAEGLQYAHEHGVIHRDIKPANIMRLIDGSVKIMDFGIARVMHDTGARLTQTGYMVGSINYMPPEQFRGARLDELCDIWSFGVVFYELLTGQHPFAASDTAALMYRITTEKPPSVQTIAPDCPAALAVMIARLLAKNRDERYQNMEDVVFELKETRRDLVAQEIPSLVARIPKLVDGHDLDGAQVVVRRLLDLDPSNTEARRWRETLRAAAKRRAARPQIEELVERASELEKAGDLPNAISSLDSALRLDPFDTALKARRNELEASQARAERVSRLLRESRAQLEGADLTAAFRLANEALEADPANQGAREMLDRVRSAMAGRDKDLKLRAGLNRAKGLLLVHSYDEAVALLSELARSTNAHPEVLERLAEARQLQREQESRQRYAADLDQARQLLRASQFERGVALLEDLNQRPMADAAAAELLSYARDQLAAGKKDAALNRITAEARAHRERGDLSQALEAIRQGLRLYPGDERLKADEENLGRMQREVEARRQREAEALRQAEAEAQRRRDFDERRQREYEDQRSREAEAQEQKAERILASGDAAGAIAILTALVAQYPSRHSLPALLDRARDLERRQRKDAEIQAALARAREIASRGDFRQAVRLLEAESARYPDAASLNEELRQIRAKGDMEDSAASIEAALKRREIDRAIQLADAALVAYPRESRLTSLREQAARARELETLLEEIVRHLLAGDFDRASQLTGNCEARFPGNHDIQRVKARVAAARARHALVVRAEQALRAKRLDEAIQAAEQALAAEPQDPVAANLLKEARRQLEVERGRSEASQLARTGRLEPAEAALESLLKQFPDEAAVRDDLERVQEAIHRQQTRQASARIREKAQQLTAKGNLDAAIDALRSAPPNDPDIATDLQSALEARSLREDRRKIDASIAVLEEQFRKGRATEVQQGAEKLLATAAEPRAHELLNWARETLAQTGSIRNRRSGRQSRKMVIGAAAVVVVAAGAFLTWRRAAPSGQIILEPSEIAFRARVGGALPAAAVTHIHPVSSTIHWAATPSENWFQVDPAESDGDADVAIALDASAVASFSEGEHSGTVTFLPRANGAVPATLRVRLRIDPREQPPETTPPILSTTEGKETKSPPKPPKEKKTEPPPKGLEIVKEQPPAGVPDAPKEQPAQPQPQAPVPLVFQSEPAVDCHGGTYTGSPRGTMRWSGTLGPGGELDIARRNRILNGGGEVRGSRLPGCSVTLEIPTPGVAVLERPSEANGYGRLRLRNSSTLAITSIQIEWTVN